MGFSPWTSCSLNTDECRVRLLGKRAALVRASHNRTASLTNVAPQCHRRGRAGWLAAAPARRGGAQPQGKARRRGGPRRQLRHDPHGEGRRASDGEERCEVAPRVARLDHERRALPAACARRAAPHGAGSSAAQYPKRKAPEDSAGLKRTWNNKRDEDGDPHESRQLPASQ